MTNADDPFELEIETCLFGKSHSNIEKAIILQKRRGESWRERERKGIQLRR